jgi:hypothetical protein
VTRYVAVVSQSLGVPVEALRPEAHFIDDLRVD